MIGAVNHAARRGISIHVGAAIAIARRGLGLSERPARAAGKRASCARGPLRDGTHVTLALPASNERRHVWGQWAAIGRELKAAQQARWRSAKAKARAAPASSQAGTQGPIRQHPVKLRGDSPLHRSGGDMDFIPQLAE